MTCEDAKPLLALHRQIAASGMSDRTIAALLIAIRQIRLEHDPSPTQCCECWVKARREAGSMAA